jgi:replicative DNA helicase
MDTTILKHLLSYEFYEENKGRLNDSLFEQEAKDLFKTIKKAHEKFSKDITTAELVVLYENDNPIATEAYKANVRDLIAAVRNADTISNDIAKDVITGLWQRSLGTMVANLGIEVSEGNGDAFARLLDLVEKYRNGFTPEKTYDFTTSDTEALLEIASDKSRWKFNLKPLHEKVYGIGPAEFASVFATPNTGKTAMMVTLCFGPDGFADQGARVLYCVNEEKSERTKLRGQMCRAGMNVQEVALDPRKARAIWDEIDKNVFMLDIHEYSMEELDELCHTVKPDIIVVDQADKINIRGKFNASHERLRELYRTLRELAKRHDAAVIAMSQASNEARGKTRITPFEMEGSKIGKSAELDLIIGIGALEQEGVIDSEPDMTRYLTIGKNKLNGWHGTVSCYLQDKISRYVG